jgi:hypothetical protein
MGIATLVVINAHGAFAVLLFLAGVSMGGEPQGELPPPAVSAIHLLYNWSPQ